MSSYRKAIQYLDTFTDYESKGFGGMKRELDLERVNSALKKLGRPDRDYRSIHIAGTKGKGSVSAFTGAILSAAGLRTGVFTSPHLIDPRERISVDAAMISKQHLAAMVEKIKDCLGEKIREELTYFEIYTLIAMLYFSYRKVDAAVFETGLGGRLDATNVIYPSVSAITPVSYDHTSVLGRSLSKIAGEKAAIIKKGSRCVSSFQRKKALDVIVKRCEEQKVPLTLVGSGITYNKISAGPEGSVFDIFTPENIYSECEASMPGEFQVENAAQAAGICELFMKDRSPAIKKIRPGVFREAVKKGIKKAFLPGRMQVLRHKPAVVIDGAQNAASAFKLKEAIESVFKYERLILVLGLSGDKDIKGVCDALLPMADHIIFTRSAHKRAAEPERIEKYAGKRAVSLVSDSSAALAQALKKAGGNDMVLVTGSFYLIGEIWDAFNRSK